MLTSAHKPWDYSTSWRVLGGYIDGGAYIRRRGAGGGGDSYNLTNKIHSNADKRKFKYFFRFTRFCKLEKVVKSGIYFNTI